MSKYPHSGVCGRCLRQRDDLFWHEQDEAFYCVDVFRCEGAVAALAAREQTLRDTLREIRVMCDPVVHGGSFDEAAAKWRLDQIRQALERLVLLKDGPRDAAYRAAKEAAWNQARAALAVDAPAPEETQT